MNGWHEVGYLEIIYPKLLEVRECRKVTQVASPKPSGSEFGEGITRNILTDPESFDEWKQTKVVRFSEWSRPPTLPPEVVGCESMVKMGDDSDVPRVTCQGACREGAGVVDEVGDDDLHKLLRELGDWGRVC